VVALNPLRWPETLLANWILSDIPIGTHIDDVHISIENNPSWQIWSREISGYYIGRFAPTANASKGRGWQWQRVPEGEGEYKHHFFVSIGEYRTLTITAVSVLFVFDADGYLIDVFIQKSTDAI